MNVEPWEKFSLVAILIAVFIVFGLGLPGDFLFDDGVNLYLNSNFIFSEFDLKNIVRATFSSDSGPFGRPVAMFSFAVNQYAAKGIDPLSFKLTNIAIHATNTILLFFLLKTLFSLSQFSGFFNASQRKFLPILSSALWAGHPLTLTSVLYVIQRMTSLSAGFMLLALIAYLLLRSAELHGKKSSQYSLLWSLVLGLSAIFAILSKETALLLGFFIALIEIFFLGFKAKTGRSICAVLLVFSSVALPILLLTGRTLLYPDWILAGYDYRPFSLSERLLTQSRVFIFYLSMIIAPSLSSMGIFHDDIQLSRGIIDPFSTLPAIVSVCLMVLVCVYSTFSRSKYFRVIGFSISWFIVGHLLESTIFPLELVHEHRNYFPMIGPVFLVVYFLTMHEFYGNVRLFIYPSVSIIALCFFLTGLRSLSWQNLTDHSLVEVLNHPRSSRAQYQMGRIYLKWFEQSADSGYLREAEAAFVNSIKYNWEGRSGPYYGLIYLHYKAGRRPEDSLLLELKEQLRLSKSIMVDIPFLGSLAQCQIANICALTDEEFLELAEAYLENPLVKGSGRSDIYAVIGGYYVNKLNERAAAERFFIQSVNESPTVPRYLDLAEYYRITARFSEAREQIAVAKKLASKVIAVNIEKTEQRLATSESEFAAQVHD